MAQPDFHLSKIHMGTYRSGGAFSLAQNLQNIAGNAPVSSIPVGVKLPKCHAVLAARTGKILGPVQNGSDAFLVAFCTNAMRGFAIGGVWIQFVRKVTGAEFNEVIPPKLTALSICFGKLALDFKQRSFKRKIRLLRIENLAFDFENRAVNVNFARRLRAVEKAFDRSDTLSDISERSRAIAENVHSAVNVANDFLQCVKCHSFGPPKYSTEHGLLIELCKSRHSGGAFMNPVTSNTPISTHTSQPDHQLSGLANCSLASAGGLFRGGRG